jgi:hypothetical protein
MRPSPSATQVNIALGAGVNNAVYGGDQYVFMPASPTADRQRTVNTAAGLAQAVRVLWRAEERRRRVHDPFPLPVRWVNADESLVDHWANVRLTTVQDQIDLAGRLGQVVDVYQRLPSRRLVVLGAAGSGKTILSIRLTLELLDRRADADPVPVIVDLSGWDPTQSSAGGWIASQLALNYPGLDAPATLIDAGMILPVLDGFDEIAHGLHAAALAELSRTPIPLVLTSRPEQYAAAVDTGDVLTAAGVIVLRELAVEDLAAYLPRSTRRTSASGSVTTKWDRVLAAMGRPEAAIREVLSTPLMVSLARTVYSDDKSADPAELLDTTRFPSRADVEAHLLDAFLESSWQHAPDGPRRRWRATDADRWLRHLACHLRALGSRDLAWWQLRDTVPRPTRLAAGVLIAGPTCLLVFGALHWVGADPISALVLGLGVGLAVGASWARRRPARSRPGRDGSSAPARDRCCAGRCSASSSVCCSG